LAFFEIVAEALAAAALGVLEAADLTIGVESESEDSLSSLEFELDSDSESDFALDLAAFFAAGLGTAFAAAGFAVVDLAVGLPLAAAGVALETVAGFFFPALGLALPLSETESESESESESGCAFLLEAVPAFGAGALAAALFAVTGLTGATDEAFAEGLAAIAAGLTAAVGAIFAGALTFAATTGGYTRPAMALGGPLDGALTVGVGESTAPTSSSNSIPVSADVAHVIAGS